ncbi:MAG: hypothetical protein EP330_22285 [Deltaproteobacteria bacterium]|nr:MAG: hypothetical protein EP330_22285 [Deltaproteobacteria bacterium]
MTRYLVPVLFLLGACGTPGDESDLFGAPQADPDLQLDSTATRTAGSLLLDEGEVLEFSSSETFDGTVEVAVELHGMRLQASRTAHGLSLHGEALDGGTALMTEADRAVLLRLTAALEAEFYPSIAHVTSKEEYRALRQMTAAEEQLFSMVEGLWSQWPSSMPLDYEVDSDTAERGITERHYYADNAYYIGGSHDCWDCDWWEGDCTDYKRIGHEFDGCNHGNTGTSCSGTQFTQDAVNHDQCVRTSKHGGHSLASLWCDDQFVSCVDDEISAPSAGYDWRGSYYYNNCPTSWKGTSDGCDVHCQFKDPDCPAS